MTAARALIDVLTRHPAAVWTRDSAGIPKRKRRPYDGPPFRYLSFGAGVQSTALLAMAVLGLRGCPPVDVAIFADTGDEPDWVYEHLNFMTAWGGARGLPVLVCGRRRMSDDMKARIAGTRSRFAGIPAFTRGPDGSRGLLKRQCTYDYKIGPLQQEVRRLLGVNTRCGVRVPVMCIQGISLDEASRAKESRDKWLTAEFPLLDARMTRNDCLGLIRELGLPKPQKSACVFCPFRSDAEWLALQRNDPAGFRHAVEMDRVIRHANRAGIENPVFLHSSMKPLDSIDFDDHQGRLDFDRDHFENACGGDCGV